MFGNRRVKILACSLKRSVTLFRKLWYFHWWGFPVQTQHVCRGNTSHGYYIHRTQLKKSKLQQKQLITITSLFIVLCECDHIRECSMATQTAHLKSNNLLKRNSVNTNLYLYTNKAKMIQIKLL